MVALAAKHAADAAVNLQGVQKLLDLKRSWAKKRLGSAFKARCCLTLCPSAHVRGSNQQVLFSAPMKKAEGRAHEKTLWKGRLPLRVFMHLLNDVKVLEKVETRIKTAQK